jgi:hypothetical protein
MSESSQSKCPCTKCLAILLIVLGVKLLSRELTRNKTE